MIEIIPTCVARDEDELAAAAAAVRRFASGVHIDVDDGVFAAHLTWPYEKPGEFDAAALSKFRLADFGLSVEAHLMVEESRAIGAAFAHAGATRIIGHIEGFADAREAQEAIEVWKGADASEVGLALLLHTPLEVVEPLIPLCDVVLLMSIASIGVQGIPHDARVLPRIRDLHARHPELLIGVDGGVAASNIADLVRAGASRFGVGAAISKAPDPKAAYEQLKSIAESALQ
jgi:ribulose-phosphate 3-epimerase